MRGDINLVLLVLYKRNASTKRIIIAFTTKHKLVLLVVQRVPKNLAFISLDPPGIILRFIRAVSSISGLLELLQEILVFAHAQLTTD